ncbi:MAG: peptidase M15 [Rhizobiales bacterium]|nr:peptidase M15 [Hyphomicrobiales bacterium]
MRIAPLLALLFASPAPAQMPQGVMPQGFVDAATVVDGLVVDMRYFRDDNFVGRRIDGYEAARCYLTRPAAAALARVQQDLASQSLGLKVFDCYRPARAVAHFVRWARDIKDVKRKADFYPDVDKRDLLRLDYIAPRSGHSRGLTVDLTLVRFAQGLAPVELGAELDMGTPFDFFGVQSWPSSRAVSAEAQANRKILAAAMRRGAFIPHVKEWWHFTLRKEPYPGSYFDFPVR